MKLVARWAQVAAIEARICQVRAPFWVLLPQEILRAMTAGRSWRSARLLVASTPSWSVKGKEMIALFMESFAHGVFVRFAAGSRRARNRRIGQSALKARLKADYIFHTKPRIEGL